MIKEMEKLVNKVIKNAEKNNEFKKVIKVIKQDREYKSLDKDKKLSY